MSYWPKDIRLFHCKYCNEKQLFNVNKEIDITAANFWEEYHSNCRKRIEEKQILRAMRMKNKRFIPYININEYTDELDT